MGKTGFLKTGFWISCAVGLIGLVTPALATEQVYHPVSPTFGGNPAIGSFLLSTAQSQGAGVSSGNNGPTINFPSLDTPTTPTVPGSAQGATGTTGSTGATSNATFRNNSLANPLGSSSGRF